MRYALVVAGVGWWLWQGPGAGRAAVIALLLSVVLVAELPLYGPRPVRGRLFWAGLQLVGGLAAFGLDPDFPVALVLTAVVMAHGATLPAAWAYASLAGAGAGSAAALLWQGAKLGAARLDAAPDALFPVLVLYGLACAAGRLAALRIHERRMHEETVTRLQEAQARLARHAAMARELAAAEEHRRLSEELHDTLGHALVGTLLQVQLAGELVKRDADAASKRLEMVETSIRETLDRVRRALRRGKRGLETLPFHLALESLAAEFRALGGPEVSLSFRPDGESVADLSPRVREALVRTVQEALTNAVRHGRARRVEIRAEASGPRLYLTIRDDGVGADAISPGMGLSGMVSRIQAVGGTLRFHSQAGEGFQIEVGVRRR